MNSDQQSGVISVFGSHAPQAGSVDYEMGREVGRRLAEAGYTVATGGYGGIMAAASQGAAEAGGMTIGITSQQVEISRPVELNRWVQQETRYETLLERVEHLVKHNQGIIVMPGGIGTLSELALAWSLMQVKEIQPRPLILLGQMWAETMAAFSKPQYIAQKHSALIFQVWTPAAAVDVLLTTSNK